MKFALSIIALLLLSQVCTAQTLAEEELQLQLQIAIRRYMQCQADNVASYNEQMKIVIEKNEKLLTELNKDKEKLTQEISKTKVTTE